MEPIKPAGLRRGDTIGVVVPAGPVDRARIDRALARLHERGFRTKTYADIYRLQGYLAGGDDVRANEFMEAFADAETSAVWCARGGYGVSRIIDKIDFAVIRRNPKVFIGFSDISILHVTMMQRIGLCTFHAPNLQDGFGAVDDMLPTTEAALWRAVLAAEPADGDAEYTLVECGSNGASLQALSTGSAKGRLVGGNLAVLCGLMGSPYEIETDGRILFLEDIDERLYKIDRYFSQLSLSGKLRSAAGILLGDFTFESHKLTESRGAIAEVFDGYFRELGIPVLAGIPAGHIRENLTLPMNALVEVDAANGRIKVCERTVG